MSQKLYMDGLANQNVGMMANTPITGVHPTERNLTPNCAVGSVGFAMLSAERHDMPTHVKIPVDWHKGIVK